MREKILKILKDSLPSECYIYVGIHKNCFREEYIRIMFAMSDHDINKVSGQKPQLVSLKLSLVDLELEVQVYGCMGGQSVYREPNMEDQKEKYLAMKGVRIPFRKPKKEEKFVLNAIKKFADNYIKILKENVDKLKYKDIVDYSIL